VDPHSHAHADAPAPAHASAHGVAAAPRARRVLWLTLGLNAVLLVAEVAGGLAFGSLALLADAAHQGSDVAALGVALVAQALVTRPGSARHTYGLRRAEALGAQVNALLLIAASVWIFVEAARRLGTPESVDGAGVVVLASVALGINLLSALLLGRVRGRDLNLRGAFLHMAADAAGSAGAIAAGIAVLAFDATWVDAVASILIGVLVIASAWGLLRDTTNVLLEGAPRGLKLQDVQDALGREPRVSAVHHLHVWELGSDLPALSVHVVLEGEPSLHDAQARGEQLKQMLSTRFGIEHATLELECHDCEGALAVLHPPAPDRSAHRAASSGPPTAWPRGEDERPRA
jgi:cobalt-zinc-cadmium efflux system protein